MVGIAFYMKRGRKVAKREEVIESVLNKNERVVISVLNSHGGNAVQKALVKETDFSKAKVSRLVKNLKDRGIVEIEPVSGRENRVLLKTGKKEQD
jgi:uncharacterized membrane protein